jgi:hypothetical protein
VVKKSRDGFDDASVPFNRLLSQMIIISHPAGINSIRPVESRLTSHVVALPFPYRSRVGCQQQAVSIGSTQPYVLVG